MIRVGKKSVRRYLLAFTSPSMQLSRDPYRLTITSKISPFFHGFLSYFGLTRCFVVENSDTNPTRPRRVAFCVSITFLPKQRVMYISQEIGTSTRNLPAKKGNFGRRNTRS